MLNQNAHKEARNEGSGTKKRWRSRDGWENFEKGVYEDASKKRKNSSSWLWRAEHLPSLFIAQPVQGAGWLDRVARSPSVRGGRWVTGSSPSPFPARFEFAKNVELVSALEFFFSCCACFGDRSQCSNWNVIHLPTYLSISGPFEALWCLSLIKKTERSKRPILT